MFKIVKILNCSSNIPEPVYVPANQYELFKAGSLATIFNGQLGNVGETDTPKYLVAENAEIGEKERVLCYPINKDTVFETEAGASYKDHKVDMRILVEMVDGSAWYAGAPNNTMGSLRVFDTLDAASPTDPILVTIY